MKITEQITRECCQPQDLLPYRGLLEKEEYRRRWVKFCRHCGQPRLLAHNSEPGFEKPDKLGIVIF